MGALISGGQLARRDEGAWPKGPVTEEQRSQAAFSAKTAPSLILKQALSRKNAVEQEVTEVTERKTQVKNWVLAAVCRLTEWWRS